MKSALYAIGAVLLAWLAYRWYKMGSFSAFTSSFTSETPDTTPTRNTGVTSSAVDNLMQAIYNFEGSGANSRATRNNNPGNLRPPGGNNHFWDGQTGVDAGGYAIFNDIGDGWSALQSDLNFKITNHPDWDFYDFFNYYLTGKTTSPNSTPQGDSGDYADYVANYIGVDAITPVSQAVAAGG
jgi:hypothetical protein